ncbi:putative tight adherance operon protein [Yersinia intermedia]|jgi:pilus assembly protein CpaC|uniref:Type II and III secretion system protein family protein n=1 Tax=Yersinia intermedia TaxID=631 RepID=A0ABX6F836_YERIN|nr:pilus assembly protein N-terminal domain-containing protein [Yersinia intermedia]MCB5298230.1 pilus assembly protein N-terminal domain-containing protein [Yersinia intermedia]MCW8113416.1 pilus assembly protein N-terminal domain-containing protein [Yersinia intermedia]MDA5482303.1 pilus assembly protein N-terminal domain-containing protein [Yersinia intermedia]MDA5495928.1 pilus assembly protein N-terminal domain-containing protein [Yersinia intermedia]MDA5518204.1 pilus assembly protein N-
MRIPRPEYISWNKLFLLFAIAICQTVVNQAYAKPVYLSSGESYIIKTEEEIDTVFVSTAAIADYELVGKNSIIVYAKKEGTAEFILFNKDNHPMIKTTIMVNDIITSAYQRIKIEYPDSNVEINKIGNSYLLTGKAESEEAKDTIAAIIGEAINKKREQNREDQHFNNPNYLGVINKIKLPESNQVNVKLTIAEVTKDFSENIGVDWSSISEASVGSFKFLKFNATGISTLVHAINDDSIARVLAEPNLSVLSGESASFLVGGEIPMFNTNQNSTIIKYKTYGIKLNIAAKVNEKNRIRISMEEEVSSVDKVFNVEGGNAYPSLRTRKAATTLELGDGESFILGGLISKSERESLKKIPFIGDIPILGAFFRNAQTQKQQTELVVVATVSLVNPVAGKDVELPDFMHTSTLERLFNFTHIIEVKRKKVAKEFLRKGGFIK